MNLKSLLQSILFIGIVTSSFAQKLPEWDGSEIFHGDWLVHAPHSKAKIYTHNQGKDLILSNGLVKRSFRITPDLACIEFLNLNNQEQLLRSVRPEAIVTIDGVPYNIGGLAGQKEHAYLLKEWVDDLTKVDSAFHYVSYQITEYKSNINWETKFWTANKAQAKGKTISFLFKSDLAINQGIEVMVNYTLFDGIPVLSKWVTVTNSGSKSIVVNQIVNETLAVVEEESAVVGSVDEMAKPNGLYIENNFAFNNAMRANLSDQATHWKVDKSYTSQVNYGLETPCLLEVYPDAGINTVLKKSETVTSIRSYELMVDSYERERKGLAIRKMYRTIFPWTTSNPIFMHLVSKNDEQVFQAIDQCAATGYEALILSFGSHCNMEDVSAGNMAKWKKIADYAHQKNIFIGSYSLFSSRSISPEDDVINPKTGKPGGTTFGNAPCMGSKWGLDYIKNLKTFITQTGFDIFENDGPYPGDICASTTHPGHQDVNDSQWKQMELQKGLYHWCNENGIYINAPDWYFMDGSNKVGIGYREVNFSLSRDQQKILNRQNIYDALWAEIPSMVWGFVPLTKYQGGGPEAVLEPLNDHIDDYRQLMMQYYGSGVQACYRGPRLYDTDKTKEMVVEVIDWYKKYRWLLNSDIIHLRRADGRDWDGILHVDPTLPEKGMLMVYNPLPEAITRTIEVPVYYTGKWDAVSISEEGVSPKKLKVDRNYKVSLEVKIPAKGYKWFVLQ